MRDATLRLHYAQAQLVAARASRAAIYSGREHAAERRAAGTAVACAERKVALLALRVAREAGIAR